MFPSSQAFILFCVVVNVVLSILDSVQGYHDDPNWQSWYRFLEPLTVGIFTVEYLIRLYAIGAHATYRHKGLYGRLQWAVTFYPLVDLLSIAPYYIDLVTPGDIMPTTFFRTFRLLRLFRLFKAGKFVEGSVALPGAAGGFLSPEPPSCCSRHGRVPDGDRR